MKPDTADRTVMTASGSAAFVGLAADKPGAARAAIDEAGNELGRTARLTVEIDGAEVPGFRIVDLPRRYTNTEDYRSGDDPAKATEYWGQSTFDDLTMERGVAPDASHLVDWRNAVEQGNADQGRKEIAVGVRDDESQSRIRWKFSEAWPTEYEPPKLDATVDGEIATESVSVAFDTVERIVEPVSAARRNPLQTGLLRFVETANGGRISNGASLVLASEVGIEAVTIDGLGTGLTVDAGRASLIVPEGVRNSGEESGTALWLLSGIDVNNPPESVSVTQPANESGLYRVPATDFFPKRGWRLSESTEDSEEGSGRSIPGWPTDRSDDPSVLLFTGNRSFEETFGSGEDATEELGMNVESVGEGEEIRPAETVFAVVDNAIPPLGGEQVQLEGTSDVGSETLFDAGGPTPLAGASYSLATLSTPDASVGGRSANPLSTMETRDLLQHESARRILERAGLTDADTVEWLDGPREMSAEFDERTVNLVETETVLRSFEGVVSGLDGPWAVGVHVARVAPDDRIIAAGVHRHPIGTVDGGMEMATGWRPTVARARVYTSETCGRLQYL